MPAFPEISAAAERNKGPILEALRAWLPAAGAVLEVASGGGQHVMHFAAALPAIDWQPSDADPARQAVIANRIAAAGLGNVRPPLVLDVLAARWPLERHYDAVVCINMLHVAPWRATAALCAGAARHLLPGGLLLLYGPFREGGRHTAPSNEAFDARLRGENAEFGVRDLDAVGGCAERAGFAAGEMRRLPANNLAVAWRLNG